MLDSRVSWHPPPRSWVLCPQLCAHFSVACLFPSELPELLRSLRGPPRNCLGKAAVMIRRVGLPQKWGVGPVASERRQGWDLKGRGGETDQQLVMVEKEPCVMSESTSWVPGTGLSTSPPAAALGEQYPCSLYT